MVADGLSVNTTLSQVANVARAQAKGQAPLSSAATARKTLEDEKRVDRIRKAEEIKQERIDPEDRREGDPDGKQRQAAAGGGDEAETDLDASDAEDASPGLRIDTTA